MRNHFAADQVVEALALADDVISSPSTSTSGGLRMRIVVRRHGEAVGAGAHDREQIAALRPADLAVLGEEIAALANRPDDVGDDVCSALRLHHRLNRLIGAVERRADQIVHAAVDDDEFLVVGFFEVQDFGEQDAGVADDDPARLQDQRDIETLQTLG